MEHKTIKQIISLDREDIVGILADYFNVAPADIDLYGFEDNYGYSCAALIENVEVN